MHKRVIVSFILCLCIALFSYSGIKVFEHGINERRYHQQRRQLLRDIQPVTDTSPQESVDANQDAFYFSSDSWYRAREINPDFTAWLRFDSGIISEPVMQTLDNDTYLHQNFYGDSDINGSLFWDCRSQESDMNHVIYGHTNYTDPAKMFSPLSGLMEQSFYDRNNTFTIYGPDHQVQYLITNVYIAHLNEAYDYTQRTFTNNNDFLSFMRIPDQENLIQAPRKVQYGESLITLQTCLAHHPDQRLIILAAALEEIRYSDI